MPHISVSRYLFVCYNYLKDIFGKLTNRRKDKENLWSIYLIFVKLNTNINFTSFYGNKNYLRLCFVFLNYPFFVLLFFHLAPSILFLFSLTLEVWQKSFDTMIRLNIFYGVSFKRENVRVIYSEKTFKARGKVEYSFMNARFKWTKPARERISMFLFPVSLRASSSLRVDCTGVVLLQ